MDSSSDDSDDNSTNRAMTYLCRPFYGPSSSTDTLTLTIRTSWIRTVHLAAQAYLHQMTTSSISEASSVPRTAVQSLAASNVTEKDILYAYIWHLLTRARIRGGGAGGSSQDMDRDDSSTSDDDYTEEVVQLFTNVDVVRDVVPIQAVVTVPLHSFFFLRSNITDETGIPHLRRYALLARAIRSAIEDTVRARHLGVLTQHKKGQTQEAALRVRTMAKRNGVEMGQTGLHIVSVGDTRGKTPCEGLGIDWYRRERRELGSDLSLLYSSWDKKQTEMGVHTAYKPPSTPVKGEYYALVWPESGEGGRRDGKWKVHLHLHPLDRQ